MKKVLSILLYLCFFGQVEAQVTDIPDPNFKSYLRTLIPTAFTKEGKLVDSLAQKYTGAIDCSGLGINAMTGLEKFTKLSSLTCSNNNLVSLEEVSNMASLQGLFCHYNAITKLPSFEKLGSLIYFRCSYNQLKNLPDLSQNTNLNTLQCDYNQLTTIQGLEQLVRLEQLYIYNNQLSSLPDLSSLQSLKTLECHSNQLQELKGLSALKNLETVVCGDNLFQQTGTLEGLSHLKSLGFWGNKIGAVPTISSLANLQDCDFNNNKLTVLPDFSQNLQLTTLKFQDNLLDSTGNLSMLSALSSVNFKNNRLQKAPILSASQTTLTELLLDTNQLEALPDLSPYTSLTRLQVQGNLLTFEDLLPLLQLKYVKTLQYAPQKQIYVGPAKNIKERDSFEWTLGIDQSLNNNSYDWYKNGIHLSTTHIGTFFITNVQADDSGTYQCMVTNPAFPNLTLQTSLLKLSITPCMDLSTFNYSTTEITCGKPGSVKIDLQSIYSDDTPFGLELKSMSSGKVVPGNGTGLYENLSEVSYILTVINAKGCNHAIPITVPKNNTACDKAIILATGEDPNKINFYIEGSGLVKIYNKSGILVKSLTAPAYWDGRQDGGEILPGLYIVEVNAKFLEVTVMK